jgi:curved DNA-binding protein CbpA
MTDYFALLDQPRRAWLEPDELKQAFHAKSRQLHPDSQPGETADGAFTALNEAYQVLLDPKRRIQHLLTLEGRSPPRESAVPNDLATLFPVVAAVTQQIDVLARKTETATTPLTRSLLKPQMLAVQNRATETLDRLRQLHADATAQAQQLSAGVALGEDDWAELQCLYLRFAYIGRWIAELQEKQMRLSSLRL